MSSKESSSECSRTPRENAELHMQIKNITLFVKEYKSIVDAYITDFFTEDHWRHVPASWQKVLLSLLPSELASLLSLQTWKSRHVWPLSLLSYRAVAHILSLNAQPTATDSALLSCSCKEKEDGLTRTHNDSCSTSVKDGQVLSLEHCYRRHVKPKKQHEILKMGETLDKLCRCACCNHVVDVGAGQGHLSRLLTYGFGLQSTTIEASGHHAPKAEQFDGEVATDIVKGRIIRRKKRQGNRRAGDLLERDASEITSSRGPPIVPGQPNHVVGVIDPDISVEAFLETLKLHQDKTGLEPSTFKSSSTETLDQTLCNGHSEHGRAEQPKFALTGLHACGDLTPTILRVFTKCPSAVAVASVACCYMKMTTDMIGGGASHDPGYPMSGYVRELPGHELTYEAREMACHFIADYHDRLLKNPPNLVIHAYRAALQEILVVKDPSIRHGAAVKLTVKRGYQLPFRQYAKAALEKLGLDSGLTDEQLEKAEGRLQEWQKVVAFFTLRLSFAPVIETLILLDRLLFLRENGIKSELFPLFDPRLSPRNFMLIGKKSMQ